MQIYNLSCLALPICIYFAMKKYHLHSGELWMLVYAALLTLSTAVDNWPMQTTHLIIITALSIHTLSLSKQTSGQLSDNKYPLIVRLFLHLQQQLSIILYAISAWLLLRLYTSRSFQWGIGLNYDHEQNEKTFAGLNQTLNGWNCTQLEQVVIPVFWVVINILSFWIAWEIIKVEKDKDNLYKEYILKYVVTPFVACSAIVAAYNLWTYLQVTGMLECVQYWNDLYIGTLVKLAQYFGFSYSVLYFFYTKKGVFEVEGEENTSDRADNEQ